MEKFENEIRIEEMLMENENLVDWVIQRFFYTTITEYDVYADLRQIGMISLYNVIKSYDESKGKLSTLAVKSIRNKMLSFINNDLYKYVQKGGEKKIHENEGMDEDTEKVRDRTVGRLDDFTGIYRNEILNYIKNLKDKRLYDIAIMLMNGYNYEEIGNKMGISKQRVQQLIIKLRKELIKNKEELSINEYDYEDENDKIEDKEVIVFNNDGYHKVFDNYLIACKVLGCNKYTIKYNLLNKKYNAQATCTKADMKVSFKFND